MKISFSNSNLVAQKGKMQSGKNPSFAKLDAAERLLLSNMPRVAPGDVLVLSPSLETVASGKLEGVIGRLSRTILNAAKGNILLVGKKNHDPVDLSDALLSKAQKAIFPKAEGDKYQIFRLNGDTVQMEEG